MSKKTYFVATRVALSEQRKKQFAGNLVARGFSKVYFIIIVNVLAMICELTDQHFNPSI